MRAKDVLGRCGEELVAARLADEGWVVLERNWRCRHGEIDLVGRSPEGALVVVEVKTRRSVAYGHPTEAVTREKLARLRRLAGLWLAAHPEIPAAPLRIDVVAVTMPRKGDPRLEHLTAVG